MNTPIRQNVLDALKHLFIMFIILCLFYIFMVGINIPYQKGSKLLQVFEIGRPLVSRAWCLAFS